MSEIIIWPTITHCLFAAFVFGGSDATLHEYQPVPVEKGGCGVSIVYVQNQSLILEREKRRVEIPLPEEKGWHRMKYYWGTDKAFIENKLTPVRMGPTSTY